MEISCIRGVRIENTSYFESPIVSVEYADPVSEHKRRVENIALGRILIKNFRKFDLEARNGFQEMSKNEQLEAINNRKREARSYLQYGSLFPYEKMRLLGLVNKKVEDIYTPFIK